MTEASARTNPHSFDRQSQFPQTVVAVSREEFIEPIELKIKPAPGVKATLPDDLQGHYFMVSPVGSPNSSQVEGDEQTVWVSKDGWTALYNGDGMVYRLSFSQGTASLKTRLVKPPSYFADLATSDPANSEEYSKLKFYNLGISRGSFNMLGIRNQLNTAFVPFKLEDDESERLLITWDVGRPFEIDPETLETFTPVGLNNSWSELLPGQQPLPFKNLMASAHPVFDTNDKKFYTLNVGKSLWTMLALTRSINVRLAENSGAFKELISRILTERNLNFTKSFKNILILFYSVILYSLRFVIWIMDIFVRILKIFTGGYDFVHLLEWEGKEVDISRKWNIVLPGNRPLVIDQTVHQMGITRDYIVFAETSFKFSLENTFPFQRNSILSSFIIFMTDFLNYPQYPVTKLFIIDKANLEIKDTSLLTKIKNFFSRSQFKDLPKVVAKEVKIQPEFSHYVLDYDNANDQIVVHAAHLAASDIAEYIRIYDRSAYDDRDPDELEDIYDDPEITHRIQQLAGNIVSPTDISRLGRLVINAKTGEIIDHKMFPNHSDKKNINDQLAAYKQDPKNNKIDPKYLLTWSTAFYVYPDQRPTQKLTDIFWNNWGAWPDTLTNRAVEAYQDYPQRLVDLDKLVDLTYVGVPSSLCHIKITTDSEQKSQIELNEKNFYQFAKNNLGTSAQFIPRPNAKDQTDGFIVCVVLTSDEFLAQSDRPDNDPEWSQNSEIWIFDAQKLNHGPLYKMSHPKLNIGFSFHTTWMPEVKSPKRRLKYDVKKDYEHLVEQLIENQPQLGDKIRKLFDEEIYPNFE
ncbi:MAG: carotenoid oxygenase family protein [Cyanobacteria bacterium J06621_8]